MGKSPYQKTTAAIRMLAYGASGDSLDEYCRVSETVALESMKRFARSVVRVFGEEYLRSPTAEDLRKIMKEMGKRGLPGCIGSIDCQHWVRKNCPTAYHGQYIGTLLRTKSGITVGNVGGTISLEKNSSMWPGMCPHAGALVRFLNIKRL